MPTRRDFLAASLAAPLASRLEAAEPQTQADRENFAETAIMLAKKAGATYSDIRINRYRNQSISTREKQVLSIDSNTSYGYGVRC